MSIYKFGPFTLDRTQLLLSCGGCPLALGPKVVETLLALVERPGEVLGKEELLERIWPEGYVEEANLAQNVYVIRKALRAHWKLEAIATVPRRGYRFAQPVSIVEEAAHALPPASPVRSGYRRYAFAAAFCLLAAGGVAGGAAKLHAPALRHNAGMSPAAARLYAMGNFYWNQRTASGVQKGMRYFRQVIAIAPRDARGYASMSEAYAIDGDYGFGPLKPMEAFKLAKAYAQRALRIDPNSAQAHTANAFTEDMLGHSSQAQAEYRRSIALDPNDATAHQWYGTFLLRRGDGARALSELQRATNLDPVSVATADWVAEAAYFSRRYRDAIAYAKQTLDLSPQRTDAYIPMGLAYEAMGEYRPAVAAYQAYAQSCAGCRAEAAALLAHVYAAAHDYDNARAQLHLAQAGLARRNVDPQDLVMALVALGHRSEALAMLQRTARKEGRALLALDPRLDPVRGDARFKDYTQGPA